MMPTMTNLPMMIATEPSVGEFGLALLVSGIFHLLVWAGIGLIMVLPFIVCLSVLRWILEFLGIVDRRDSDES